MDDGFQVKFLGRDKREALFQVEAHLMSEHADGEYDGMQMSAADITAMGALSGAGQHGFTTHGSFKPSSFAESFRFSFFMEIPCGVGIPPAINSCFAIPLSIASALLK